MLLHFIWMVSLGLAAASLGAMSILIIRRMVADWWDRRRTARQKVLREVVFEYVENPEEGRDFLRRLTEDDKQDIRDMIEDLAPMLRGGSRDNLLQMITELGGLEFFSSVLVGGCQQQRPSTTWPVASNWFLPPGWGREDHRLQAVASLALFDDPRATMALRAGLADRSPRVRLAVARALIERGAEGSVRGLLERLDIGDGIHSRGLREVVRDLAPRHVVEMGDLLGADIPDTMRTLIVYGLAGLRDPFLLPAVATQFASPSVDVRAECLRALTMIGHPNVAPTVLAGLADDSWVVRAQASIAAGTIGIGEARPKLIALLDDEVWWVRFRAAQALARSGDAGRDVLKRLAASQGAAGEIASAVLAEVGASA